MEFLRRSNSSCILIVSSECQQKARQIANARLHRGPGKFERWEGLHNALLNVFSHFGTVSGKTNPLPDLYLSGDWFHENSDGFSICSLKPIKKQMLEQLPQVLSRHHRDAVLELNGIEPPIDGLTVFATSSKVLVSWDGLDKKVCEQRLQELGVDLRR